MKIRIFKTEKSFIKATLNFISKICLPIRRRGRKKKSRIKIALSGGNTPQQIYKALKKLEALASPAAGGSMPAVSIRNNIHFYQVDERYVPKNHPDSNQKMIRKTLNPENFHYFDTSLPISKSLKKYQQELPKTGFDLTILGIGPDGHIASLFPNSKALNSRSKVAHTTTKNFAVRDRLTLTFPTILKSTNILILLKNRSEILRELKSGKKSFKQFPAKKLLKHKQTFLFSL